MMKYIFSILFILIVFGCNKSKDMLMDSELATFKYQKYKNQMIDRGLFVDPNEDSTTFRYHILKDGIKYETEVSLNTGSYKFGKIRAINVSLNSDTFYMNGKSYPSKAGGPRLKKDVDQIYELYNEWYGEPERLKLKYPLEGMSGYNYDYDYSMMVLGKKIDSSGVPERTAVWKRDNFEVTFYLPFPLYEDSLDSALVYMNSRIDYEVLNSDIELEMLKDSIRMTLTPEDLITMEVYQPIWSTLNTNTYSGYDSKIEVNVREIRRKDLEEPKGVTGVRFDIVITDKFNKELCRMKDATYEPSQPLMNGSSGILTYNTATTTFATNYFKNTKSSDSLERARIYSKTNKVKVHAEIKAIVFTDGSVLESKK